MLFTRKPRGFMVRRQSDDFADGFSHAVVNRPHSLVHHASHRRRGMRKFVHHQAGSANPAVLPCTGSSAARGSRRESFLRAKGSRPEPQSAPRSVAALTMPQHFRVQPHLVAKGVIHRRDIRARARQISRIVAAWYPRSAKTWPAASISFARVSSATRGPAPRTACLRVRGEM